MKIIELLNSENTYSCVQGLRTRILLTDQLYKVFERNSNSPKGIYPYLKYQGYDEEEAVACFIESEKL